MNNWQTTCTVCMDSMLVQCTRWVHSVDGEKHLPTINPVCVENGCKNAENANSKLCNLACCCYTLKLNWPVVPPVSYHCLHLKQAVKHERTGVSRKIRCDPFVGYLPKVAEHFRHVANSTDPNIQFQHKRWMKSCSRNTNEQHWS